MKEKYRDPMFWMILLSPISILIIAILYILFKGG